MSGGPIPALPRFATPLRRVALGNLPLALDRRAVGFLGLQPSRSNNQSTPKRPSIVIGEKIAEHEPKNRHYG